MNPGPHFRACITLARPEDGGLTENLHVGARHLLLRFAPMPGRERDVHDLGGIIESMNRQPIEPGRGPVEVRVTYWAEREDALKLATPGREFDLWNGRVVGRGVVMPEIT
jgi:hypothetical protein